MGQWIGSGVFPVENIYWKLEVTGDIQENNMKK